MNQPPRTRKARSSSAGRPTTVTIYMSAPEEEALSERAKSVKQSVPAFIANVLRERLRTEGEGGAA
jgi:hypothetical protein